MRNVIRLAGALLLGLSASMSVWAGPGPHVGIMVGGPFWGPPPYYGPYPYYYPPAVVVQPTPPVYIQQAEPAPTASAANAAPAAYWYYCAAAKSYYPYVKECPGGWQRVSPQPPAQ